MRSTHRRISCSMVVGRASTPTSSNPVSSWCKDSPRVARASLTFECHYHQKSAPPYKHQEHKTTHDLETILQATHPPPPAWGFSIKLLSISFLCCLNLGLIAFVHVAHVVHYVWLDLYRLLTAWTKVSLYLILYIVQKGTCVVTT